MVFHPSLPLAGTFSLHRAVAAHGAGRSASALLGGAATGGAAGRRRREPRGAGARTFAGGEVVSTDKAPAAVGPYSQVRPPAVWELRRPLWPRPTRWSAVPGLTSSLPVAQAIKANGMLFVSGCVALLPGTKELVQDSIEAETEQVMKNMGAILEAAGCSYGDVVKTTVLLDEMSNFAAVNSVYGAFTKRVIGCPLGPFPPPSPVRRLIPPTPRSKILRPGRLPGARVLRGEGAAHRGQGRDRVHR